MYFVGIDIGSTASKTAVFQNDRLVETCRVPTGWNSAETAESIQQKLIASGYPENEMICIATGYGRISVPFAKKCVTEITCHGKGASYLFQEDGVIIDIGGQDTKVIKIQDGLVQDFLMNDKCSAGTGRFLEIMANTLGVTLEQLSAMASEGRDSTISSMCTVFAESEVISLIGSGEKRENIAFAVVESVVGRVTQLASKLTSDRCYLTGGFCGNDYVLNWLSRQLDIQVKSHELAQYAGAIGAALIGVEKYTDR